MVGTGRGVGTVRPIVYSNDGKDGALVIVAGSGKVVDSEGRDRWNARGSFLHDRRSRCSRCHPNFFLLHNHFVRIRYRARIFSADSWSNWACESRNMAIETPRSDEGGPP